MPGFTQSKMPPTRADEGVDIWTQSPYPRPWCVQTPWHPISMLAKGMWICAYREIGVLSTYVTVSPVASSLRL